MKIWVWLTFKIRSKIKIIFLMEVFRCGHKATWNIIVFCFYIFILDFLTCFNIMWSCFYIRRINSYWLENKDLFIDELMNLFSELYLTLTFWLSNLPALIRVSKLVLLHKHEHAGSLSKIILSELIKDIFKEKLF